MSSRSYVHWPKHRKKAAEQKRRKRQGLTLEDLRIRGEEKRRQQRIDNVGSFTAHPSLRGGVGFSTEREK